MIVYLMGVSGSGKSTIGARLAERMSIPFADGDDYHPASNKWKMARGIPLDDDDRRHWLLALNQLARETEADRKSIVIACSALKAMYREWLTEGLPKQSVSFVLLKGSRELIADRLSKRQHQFMNPNLLASQLATLEEPEDAIKIVNEGTADEVAEKIQQKLAQASAPS